ncbi:unnamed protein product, partial [marine sediment metagenome]
MEGSGAVEAADLRVQSLGEKLPDDSLVPLHDGAEEFHPARDAAGLAGTRSLGTRSAQKQKRRNPTRSAFAISLQRTPFVLRGASALQQWWIGPGSIRDTQRF